MKSKVVALTLFLILSSCSSDDNAGSASTSPTSATEDSPALVQAETTTTAISQTTVEPEAESPNPVTSESVVQSSTVTEPPAAEPTASDDEAVAERIRGYFDAREAANSAPSPNPDDPVLAEFATGTELASVVEETTAKRDAGRAIRPGEGGLAEVRVGSVVVDDATGTAAVCSIDDGVVFDVDLGDVIDDSVVTHSYTVQLAVVDGVWKVSQIVRLQMWEGVAGCALALADYPY